MASSPRQCRDCAANRICGYCGSVVNNSEYTNTERKKSDVFKCFNCFRYEEMVNKMERIYKKHDRILKVKRMREIDTLNFIDRMSDGLLELVESSSLWKDKTLMENFTQIRSDFISIKTDFNSFKKEECHIKTLIEELSDNEMKFSALLSSFQLLETTVKKMSTKIENFDFNQNTFIQNSIMQTTHDEQIFNQDVFNLRIDEVFKQLQLVTTCQNDLKAKYTEIQRQNLTFKPINENDTIEDDRFWNEIAMNVSSIPHGNIERLSSHNKPHHNEPLGEAERENCVMEPDHDHNYSQRSVPVINVCEEDAPSRETQGQVVDTEDAPVVESEVEVVTTTIQEEEENLAPRRIPVLINHMQRSEQVGFSRAHNRHTELAPQSGYSMQGGRRRTMQRRKHHNRQRKRSVLLPTPQQHLSVQNTQNPRNFHRQEVPRYNIPAPFLKYWEQPPMNCYTGLQTEWNTPTPYYNDPKYWQQREPCYGMWRDFANSSHWTSLPPTYNGMMW